MAETTRFGLEKFGGPYGGSGADLGAKFSTTDRDLLDKVLAFFEDHKHDGGSAPVALASPTVVAAATQHATGGQIARGTTRYYKYTLIDRFGMETAASPELTVTLPGVVQVTVSPVLTGGTSGGSTLPVGSYYYALTGNTVNGETTLGPEAIITVQTGQNQVAIVLPSLPSGIDSWNVWRMGVTEEGWTKVFDAQAPGTVTDVGHASGSCLCDPTTQPPTVDLISGGTYSITVTPDSGALATSVSWRLYETDTSGFYSSASLVAAVVPTVVGNPPPASYLDTGAALLTGQPPMVSTTLKPSHGVAGGGGSGGGGADSHLILDLFPQATPANAVQQPVYFLSANVDLVGHDLTLIYEPNGDNFGDEIQVNTAAVYAPFMHVHVEGVAPGDVVQGSFDEVASAALVTSVMGDTGQLVCPPGQSTIDGVIALPARYMAFGSRHRFAITAYFVGGAPTVTEVGGGLAMASGTPIDAEFYVAPVGFAASNPVDGEVDLTWTTGPDSSFDVIAYSTATFLPVGKQTVTTGSASFTGLTDGIDYFFVLIAKKGVSSVDVYSTAAQTDDVPAIPPGPHSSTFTAADGTNLLAYDTQFNTTGASGGVLTILSNRLVNSGSAGPMFALHNLGADDKKITLDHFAIAGPPLIVQLARGGAFSANPSVTVSTDGSAIAPTVDHYDSGGAHTAITMTAASGSTWTAYQGSSASLDFRLMGTDVQVYQGGVLCWVATIPSACTGSTYGGVGLFNGATAIDNFDIDYPAPGPVTNVVIDAVTDPTIPVLTWDPPLVGGVVHQWSMELRDASHAFIDGHGIVVPGARSWSPFGEGLVTGTTYYMAVWGIDIHGVAGPVTEVAFIDGEAPPIGMAVVIAGVATVVVDLDPSGSGGGAPAFVQSKAGGIAYYATSAVVLDAAATPGNLLVAGMRYLDPYPGGTHVGAPAGWDLKKYIQFTPTGDSLNIYTRTADGTSSDHFPLNNAANNGGLSAVVFEFSNSFYYASESSINAPTTSGVVHTPGIPAEPGDIVLTIAGSITGPNGYVSMDAGLSNVVQGMGNGQEGTAGGWEAVTASGTTPSRAATWLDQPGGGVDVIGASIRLTPAAPPYAAVPATFTETNDSTSATLTATTGPDSTMFAVRVRRTTGPVPPVSATDGTLVGDIIYYSGGSQITTTGSVTDSGLTPGTQYSYAAFACTQTSPFSVDGSDLTVTTTDPATYTDAGGDNVSASPDYEAAGDYDQQAMEFTLSANASITALEYRAGAGGMPAGATFELVTDLLGTPTVLGTGTLAATVTSAWARAVLDHAVDLVAGTQYWFAITSGANHCAYKASSSSLSGIVASVVQVRAGTGNAWGTTLGGSAMFRLDTSP